MRAKSFLLLDWKTLIGGVAGLALITSATCAEARISVDVKINDHPIHMMFDTGAGVDFLLWRTTAEKLQLPITLPPPNYKPPPGNAIVGKCNAAKVEVLGVTFKDTVLRVYDKPAYLPGDFEGILGWTIARSGIISLRVAESRCEFVTSIPPEVRLWKQYRIRTEFQMLVLEIPSADRNHPGLLLIDTGDSWGVKVSPMLWQKWETEHPEQPCTIAAIFTPGVGLEVLRERWAGSIDLNGFPIGGVPISESGSFGPSMLGPSFLASLGLAALARIDLFIDGKNGLAYVNKREGAPPRMEHNRLGAVFVPRSDKSDDLVAHVVANSPAVSSGIRDGDVLLTVNGLDVTKWRTQRGIVPLSRFWAQSVGTKMDLLLVRDGKTFRAECSLQDILVPDSP